MRPKAWFKPTAGSSTTGNDTHTGQTKYALPEIANTNLGKAWQFYGERAVFLPLACALY